MNQYNPEEEEVVVMDAEVGDIAELLVYNDDYNTFDWVIKCLIDVCSHSETQAEQLSLIVHFKGKAVVKTAVFDVLKPMKDALVDRGLSAIIETVKERS